MQRHLPAIFRYTALVIASVLLFLLVAGIFIFLSVENGEWCETCGQMTVQSLEDWIRSLGMWGIVGSICLMIIHSFIPFPAEFLAMANGAIYGPVWGTCITWTGAMLGAWLAFGLARAMGRPFVHRMLTKKNAQYVDVWVATHGGGALLVCRLIPVIAFNLINYAAGLTRVSWWTYTWSTAIGILPLTILMVVMGDQMDKLPWQIWPTFLIFGLSCWAVVHHFSHHESENT